MKEKLVTIVIGVAAAVMLAVIPVHAEDEASAAQTVYTTDCVNVRDYPSLDSEILFTLNAGTPVQKVTDGVKFDLVSINNQLAYICNDYLSEDPFYNESDLRLLSAIIFEEAGNQCLAGQQAVGIVVLNRVRSEKFPNTISEVLYQYGQFFNPSCPSFYNQCLNAYDNGTIPQSCIEAAIYVLNGNISVNYNGLNLDLSNILYFSRYRSDCKIQIQDHQFA